MFECLSHLALQQYWWIIVSLLGAILVFLMFVQGGQTLITQVGKTENQRSILINSIGRKWDLTFTTLVTFGGAFFASFPLFYSTSFGGAYWVWMIILFSFVLQAVSYEFRTKPNNLLGTKTFDIFLLINGILGTVLIGAAVGTFFSGSMFSVEKMNLTDISSPVISRWQNNLYGLEAALNIFNVLLGLSVLFLSRILGLLYFMNNIEHTEIINNCKKHLKINTVIFLLFFLTFLGLLLTKDGFSINETNVIELKPYKYLLNLIEMPLVLVLFLLGVISVLSGIFINLFKKSDKGIWFSGIGTILVVFSLFLIAGFNNTAYYPSVYDLQSSLTIENSSSSHYTLTAMSYVSLLVPFVIAYIWYAWSSINKEKITEKEITNTEHKY